MRIAVFGTGEVGCTLGDRLLADGHEVVLGSRSADHPIAVDWAGRGGTNAGHGTFADAAACAEMIVNATAGQHSLDALATVPAAALADKTLIDVANALDFSAGFPPTLAMCNTTSLGEQIQQAHPQVRVVKALNTMHNTVMVDPARVAGQHHVFLCGNDAGAKQQVIELILPWGWTRERIIDLGDITNARGTEMVLPLWVRLYAATGHGDFNLAVAGR